MIGGSWDIQLRFYFPGFYLFLAQPLIYGFTEKHIQNRSHWDKYQYPDYSHQTSAQDDCHKYSDGWQSIGSTHYKRINQVAFYLLQNNEKHNKPDCFARIDDQNEKHTETASYKCAKHWIDSHRS